MIIGTAIALTALSGTIAVVALQRRRHYRRLAFQVDGMGDTEVAAAHTVEDFSAGIAVIPEFLDRVRFETLQRDVEALAGPERSYVPTHKKGGTIAYATLIEHAPAALGLYHSPALCRMISDTVGIEVRPTPLNDQNSLSVLVYERPGDHIGWHYDHNFYLGRHFTVLLPVVNRGDCGDGLSHARLSVRLNGTETDVAAAPNTLVLFEGARVLHKVSPIEAGERRVVISMTFSTDGRASIAQAIARRVKDMAFFGVRALWT